MRRLIYFTKEVWERVEIEAKKIGMSKSGYIRMVLINYWKQMEEN